MATAFLKNYRQSPRKVRLVADAIRGKKVGEAQTVLNFMPKRAATPLKKLLESAMANAKQAGDNVDTLIVKEISVLKGVTLHRWMPRARGSAAPLNKRSSHVQITLGEGKVKKVKVVASTPSTESVDEKTKSAKSTKTATKSKTTKKVTKKSEK